MHVPKAHVLQLSGHGVHELMTITGTATVPVFVVLASNPSAQLKHSKILSGLQLVHPDMHLTHCDGDPASKT